jgi:hypothetical protein
VEVHRVKRLGIGQNYLRVITAVVLIEQLVPIPARRSRKPPCSAMRNHQAEAPLRIRGCGDLWFCRISATWTTLAAPSAHHSTNVDIGRHIYGQLRKIRAESIPPKATPDTLRSIHYRGHGQPAVGNRAPIPGTHRHAAYTKYLCWRHRGQAGAGNCHHEK